MATASPFHDISQEMPESERDIPLWTRNHIAYFQHNIDTLKLQTLAASKAYKDLLKEQANIERKSHKEKSKELHGCIDKYQNCISVLQAACKEISGVVNNTKVPLVETRSTYDGRGKKRNKSSSYRDNFRQLECDRCNRKDAEIMKLESDLERINKDVRGKIADHGEEMKRTIAGYEEKIKRKEIEYQARTNEEIERTIIKHELETKRKEEECQEKINTAVERKIADYEEETKRKILGYEEEIKRNGTDYQESLRRMQDENESLRSQLQIETEAKEDALRRIKETEKQIAKYEEELKRKEAECQEKMNKDVKRKIEENEEQTKRKMRRYEEEGKRKEAEYQERMRDVSERLGGQLQIEIEAKENALRRIKETERQMSTYEVELKRREVECQEKINQCLKSKIADHEEETKRKIWEYEEELKRKEAGYQESQKRMQVENERLCSQLQMEIGAKEDAKRRTEEAERTLEGYEVELKRKEEGYREICRINEDMKRKIQKYEEETNRKIWGYEEEIKRKEMDYQESQRRMYDEMERLRGKLQTETKAKEDALRRFSSMASSTLRDNNPNITDLSDQNRPTKIAERLSELYDNQWTDAFDALESSMPERQIIQTLLDTLMNAYEECCKLSSENFYERIQNCIESPLGPNSRPPTAIVLPEQLKQQIKEFRKSRAAHVIKDLEQVITPKLQIPNIHFDAIQAYVSQCVWIGWFCAVQDPPLVLSISSPSKFDTSCFKEYTKRGPYVQFIVWPALLLQAQGAMLCKGIAQGCDSPPEK